MSTPSFDPNGFARGLTRSEYLALTENPDQPLFNRAMRGTYPPGSTIKPLMALAGLEYDVIKPEDHVYCRGSYSLPGSRHRFRDLKREGHGSMDMQNAVDAVLRRVLLPAREHARHRAHARLDDAHGLRPPTGIDIAGERGGIMPSPEWKKGAFPRKEQQVWFPGETVIVGIGQGYWTATPLQLAKATALARNARPAATGRASCSALVRSGDRPGRAEEAGGAAAHRCSRTRPTGRSSSTRWWR